MQTAFAKGGIPLDVLVADMGTNFEFAFILFKFDV